ncbi:PA0069 family radical SAM protein [Anianabacter salinae]|uniref:PA0069 family radical SAM protein n=1 Tax=Anianabacter salinae TaxID=2851023 RepID=UPI00225E135D|nr:PA0069 family radical SAM protein [Anianabacter salinae]MBV0911743.1 PA0069 family radical SAM protein [Anianabacter salinae]
MSESESHTLDPKRRKGRGVSTNRTNRFEKTSRVAVHDGWDIDDDLPPFRTEVSDEVPRSVITRNTSPDIGFDRSINPYRGCEHGCVYCFARPSHAFLGLSPGLDFETRLIARPEAPRVLADELRAKKYRPATIAIGTNTDPYQPIEGDRRVMRGILEVLQAHRHPVAIVTKGTLIERDIDILSDMAAQGLARVGISVTTLDRDLARKMEPRVPGPERRLATIRKLADAGIPVRVMASPMIPGLTDHELEAILQRGAVSGATTASYIMLRLPREVAELFRDWLAEAVPGQADKVMARVRAVHGGRDYDPEWGKRMTGEGAFANLLKRRFDVAAARLGLTRDEAPLRTDLFRVPPRVGDQLSLF